MVALKNSRKLYLDDPCFFIQNDVKLGPQITHRATDCVVVVRQGARWRLRAQRTRDEGEKGAERGHKGVRSHGITLHHVQIPMVIFSSAAILLVLA